MKEFEKLKATTDTSSNAYLYLNWKINYAACQIYNIENWPEVEGGLGFFNAEMNEIIGPESDISWYYGLKFYQYHCQFNNGKLADDDDIIAKSPINYLPEIKNRLS